MTTDLDLHVLASLLRRGHAIDMLSTGLALIGALIGATQLMFSVHHPWASGLGAALLLLGALQKYWALRIGFDADLLQRIADSPLPLKHNTLLLDQALKALGLQPAAKSARSWDERARGVFRLLYLQIALVVLQLTLMLSFTFASHWLMNAG